MYKNPFFLSFSNGHFEGVCAFLQALCGRRNFEKMFVFIKLILPNEDFLNVFLARIAHTHTHKNSSLYTGFFVAQCSLQYLGVYDEKLTRLECIRLSVYSY